MTADVLPVMFKALRVVTLPSKAVRSILSPCEVEKSLTVALKT